MEKKMNQIKKKRRLSPLEAAVLGNILYLVIVLIFKSIFDVIRTTNYDYLFNGVQLLTVGVFWIALFTICFKNISGNEKPRTVKYIFFSLIPIAFLTVALTLVSKLAPGQDTSSIWNQFAFLAAPTIFWYLPYGLIYQLIGTNISIFIFFGIALVFTVAFQIIGVVIGRIVGHKYLEETKEAYKKETQDELKAKKEKKTTKKKTKLPKRSSIGIDGLSDETINEGFTPEVPVNMNMTEVIIEDTDQNQGTVRKDVSNSEHVINQKSATKDTGLFERISAIDEQTIYSSDRKREIVEPVIEPAKIPDLEVDANRPKEKTTATDEWEVTQPMSAEKILEELNKHPESQDKSFLKETSAIRIINEEDIEEYYRNKK